MVRTRTAYIVLERCNYEVLKCHSACLISQVLASFNGAKCLLTSCLAKPVTSWIDLKLESTKKLFLFTLQHVINLNKTLFPLRVLSGYSLTIRTNYVRWRDWLNPSLPYALDDRAKRAKFIDIGIRKNVLAR